MITSELSWRVVLVRPRNPLNIGAAARAMTNFGIQDLVVVSPYDPIWQETRSAVGAEDLVRQARAVERLSQAIGDCTLVLGTTSGSRRNLDRDPLPLPDLPGWLESRLKTGPAGRAHEVGAILFGSEKTGLSREDLSFCHALLQIPTSAACPSMNLGQAVAVCCYELARAGFVSRQSGEPRVHLSDPANQHSLEHIFDRAARVLDYVGYLKPKDRAPTLIKLRRVLLDRGLTNNDAKILGGILAQIQWKLGFGDEGGEKADFTAENAEHRRETKKRSSESEDCGD